MEFKAIKQESDNLQSEVINSNETSSEIREETKKAVGEGFLILHKIRMVKGKDSQEFYDAAKEYEDVRLATIKALQNDQKITKEELGGIRQEFEELKEMDISKKKNEIQSVGLETLIDKSPQINSLSENSIPTNEITTNKGVNKIKTLLDENKTYNDVLTELKSNPSKVEEIYKILSTEKFNPEFCPQLKFKNQEYINFKLFVKFINQIYLENIQNDFHTQISKVYGEEKGNLLIESIENQMQNKDLCTLTLRKIIDNFNKENGIKLERDDIQKLIDGTLEVQKTENEVKKFKIIEKLRGKGMSEDDLIFLEIQETEEDIIYVLASFGAEDLAREYIEIRELNKSITRAINNNDIVKDLSDEEYKEMTNRILEGEDGHEIMVDIKEKYYKRKTLEASNTLLESGNISQIIENSDGSGTYYFETISGEKIEDLTKDELINLGDNPESVKNLINAKNKLYELNIGFVWENRELFFKAMKTVKGGAEINNLDKDNISEGELLNILNFILEVLGEEANLNDISKAGPKLRDIGNSWLDSGKTDLYGRSPIENMFINKGYIDFNSGLSKLQIGKIVNKKNWVK